jgi:cell division protein FtsB
VKKLDLSKLRDNLKKIKLNDRRIIIVIAIILVVLLMMDFNNRMVLLLRLNDERNVLSTQVTNLELTRISFEDQVRYATSDPALEEWAREEARMIEEGDVPIIVIAPVDETPIPTPIVISTQQPIARWQIWQELFFGED